jgi:histidinol dehydrogenase
MIKIIDTRKSFIELKALLQKRKAQNGAEIAQIVRGIIAQVQQDGDAALVRFAKQFDGLEINATQIAFSPAEIAQIANQCDPEIRTALEFAAKRITDFHKRQLPKDFSFTDEYGNKLGMSWNAVDSAGIYVPGGKASYPSSVLMNAIPAKVAGVARIAMCVPTPNGDVNPAIMLAAQIAGITEIYRIGGAGAIASMAYGTESIAPVNVIAGPGNTYVAEAKRQAYGVVGIDMVAGPSEIAIIADGSTNASWVAADLLSQAEHDELAQSILITTNHDYANEVIHAINEHLINLPRREIMEKSLSNYGAIVLVEDLMQACEASNIIAPEHLELCVENSAELLPYLRHAGAIFSGSYTPEAIGDYVGGSSHVLPTTQTAAFASGLSVYNFMKKISHIECSPSGFAPLAHHAAIIADCEGLSAHALSLRIRNEK